MDDFKFFEDGAGIAKLYQNTKDEDKKKNLIMKIFMGVYFNLNKIIFIDKDEDLHSDFSLFFYNKIPTLLEKYDEEKSSFKTYLTTSIKWAIKSFYYEKMAKTSIDEILEDEEKAKILEDSPYLKTDDTYDVACEQKVVYGKGDDEDSIPQKKSNIKFDKNFYSALSNYKKYIFLLACKASLFLDNELTKKIALEMGLPKNEFSEFIEKLRKTCHTKQNNINKVIMKRNMHYIKMKVSEKIISSSSEYKATLYERAKKSLDFNYKAWLRAVHKNKSQIKTPSDKTIGEFLQLSRGTITRNIDKAMKELYN